MFRYLLIAAALLCLSFAGEICDPATQVCDTDEIEEEMKAASKRGFAFIQAKSERRSAAKARKVAQIQDSLATHNDMVNEQVELLKARHGPGSVLHKRTAMAFTVEEL
mmetsp:Transcript_58767/g.182574  ORF Transcript_58767/g.182574 Transcript_58767/m.182574 type:complete len:108 (+) Transcript_58767:135-458(+)